jgi:recombination protein RecT
MSDNAVTVDNGALTRLLDKSREQIARALPRHLTADRMIRLAQTAYSKTPDLQECDLISIVGCVIQASQLGLEIDGTLGHAYLVPFWNNKARRKEAQLIVGYKGYIALALRSGKVHAFGAQVIYDGDEVQMEYGTEQKLIHRPRVGERGAPVAVYSLVHPREGPVDFELMSWGEVQQHKERFARRNKAGEMVGPWVTDELEMARKTPIRRHAKRLMLSVEFRDAAVLDGLAEAGEEQDLAIRHGLTRADLVAAKIGARAAPATQEQRNRISQLAEQRGLTEDGSAELLDRVGAADSAKLSHDQAARIIDILEGEPQEEAAPTA